MKPVLLLFFVLLVNLSPAWTDSDDNEIQIVGDDMDEDRQQFLTNWDDSKILNIWHKSEIKPRRYDIKDLGYDEPLHGWFDVQGQGAANDYCRFVGNHPKVFLSCALAGTHGESEYNFNSQELGFDKGYDGTAYMKDEDRDGRDDYCRCVGAGETERVSCTKAGPNGFYGSSAQPGTQDSFSPTGAIRCSNRKVRPEFGRPWSMYGKKK